MSPDKKVELAEEILRQNFVKAGRQIKKFGGARQNIEETNTKLRDVINLVNNPRCEKVKIALGPGYYTDQAYHFATGKPRTLVDDIKYYLKWDDNDGVYVLRTRKNHKRLFKIYHVFNLTHKFPTIKKDELGLFKRMGQKRSKNKKKPKENK